MDIESGNEPWYGEMCETLILEWHSLLLILIAFITTIVSHCKHYFIPPCCWFRIVTLHFFTSLEFLKCCLTCHCTQKLSKNLSLSRSTKVQVWGSWQILGFVCFYHAKLMLLTCLRCKNGHFRLKWISNHQVEISLEIVLNWPLLCIHRYQAIS